MTNKEKVVLLRSRIPVGLKQGLDILEKVNGDIDEAENLFYYDILQRLINSQNISEEIAKEYLKKHKFDIDKAIENIDNEKYTLTQLILRRYKTDKEEALFKILIAIEEKENLSRDFWLTLDSINELNMFQYCLAMILVWIDYEEYEGFEYALNFRLELTLDEIKNQLFLNDFADNLQKAYNRKKAIELKYQSKIDSVEIFDKLRKDEQLQVFNIYFDQNRSKLIDSLYDFVIKNIHHYP
jgi:hypothetical protein